MNGFIQEREAGRAEDAVALGVHLSHQHVVQAWTEASGGGGVTSDGSMSLKYEMASPVVLHLC